ncbi:hypothetical protein PGT21_037148 [Puccinia graminis f. sp. tritici]|uniref:Uncharacterized protein n=1 Tax=Puccinia graminis f. sp. tritici TaxID=56615 RepID=A0A5B0R546_PUCGR|nr:hypothetical protein PGTUg99_027293 [Puccinia graminis f. sp. tritici]KAA1120095.1 hypothetical protein PGT21_037148 [Puccinia graminis f. sp. tritici]
MALRRLDPAVKHRSALTSFTQSRWIALANVKFGQECRNSNPPQACLATAGKPTAGDYAPRYEAPQIIGRGGMGQADGTASVKHSSTRARGVVDVGDLVSPELGLSQTWASAKVRPPRDLPNQAPWGLAQAPVARGHAGLGPVPRPACNTILVERQDLLQSRHLTCSARGLALSK